VKLIDHCSKNTYGPMSFQIWMMGPKMWSSPNKMEVLFNNCFINLLPSHTVEAIEPPQPPFGPPDPQIRVKSKSRWLKRDQVNYWEGALQLLFYKLYLKMIDQGSRSKWGPGPSRSRLVIQKCDPPPLKLGHPTTSVLWNFHQIEQR
jgi:hypothetical protein